jgi:hypothetical protein
VGGARFIKHWVAVRSSKGTERSCWRTSQVVEAGKAESMWPDDDAARLETNARQQLETLVGSGELSTER